MARYAVSDIHGCLRTFKKALQTVGFSKRDSLVICGDYVDRGLDSKGVIQYILELIVGGFDIIPLKGNHEDFLLGAISKRAVFHDWMNNGGYQTLVSYGYNAGVDKHWITFIPDEHIQFIKRLPLIFNDWDDYVFCHGGLDFTLSNPIEDSSADCILWNRTGYVDNTSIGGKTLITGHTVQSREKVIHMIERKTPRHIIIDRGCVFQGSDYNHLAILNLDTLYVNFIKNIDNIQRD